jgi:hypothetical protein
MVALVVGAMSAIAFVHAAAGEDDAAEITNSAAAPGTRFGLFNWLDHGSAYNQEFFPEPLLVEDIGLEDNELELSWLHTKGGGQQSDAGTVEIQKGFGLLTLQVEAPYERIVSPGQIAQGVGNVDFGARYPVYQFVSDNRFVDATFGAALEGGFPVHFAISRNADLEPEAFNALKLGEHFFAQTVLGYSTLFSGGTDGGMRTFEYGVSSGYIIPHDQLPLPGLAQFIPIFELLGETELNQDDPGQNSLLGDIGFRAKLKSSGEMHPEFGLGYVFPMDNEARAELHWGFLVSVVFEF